VSYVAKNQRPGRISLLFPNGRAEDGSKALRIAKLLIHRLF